MTMLAWIEPQFIKTSQDQRPDLDQYVVCGVHLAPGASSGVARAWKVEAAGHSNAGEIAIPSEGGKVDSVSCKVLQSGAVRFIVSQAATPGGSGATATDFAYVVPGVFAAAPDAPAGGTGGFIQAPGGAITLLSAALDKNTSIDLAAHNVPPASCYSIQVQVAAPASGRRACVGAAGPAYAMITATAQAPNVEISSCGVLAVPGGVLSVVVDSGPVARCEVYVLGWWY